MGTEIVGTRGSRTPRLEHTRVADAMHRGVLSCPPETPLRDIARTMAVHRVHCIVVIAFDERVPTWRVLSDLDLVAAVAAGDAGERTAGEVAASETITVPSDERLDRAAQLMAEHQVSHLIALAPESGRPAGVLSTLDIAGLVASDDG